MLANLTTVIVDRLCAQSLCVNMAGDTPGFVVDAGDFATGVAPTTMMVAIDTSSVASNIKMDVNNVSCSTVAVSRSCWEKNV
jgi:hypothetical protein